MDTSIECPNCGSSDIRRISANFARKINSSIKKQIELEKFNCFCRNCKYRWPLKISDKLKDAIDIPSSEMDIIGEYGAIVDKLTTPGRVFLPISALPYSKDRIEKALKIALEIASNPEVIQALKAVQTKLKTFIPDNEVEEANKQLLSSLKKQLKKLDG